MVRSSVARPRIDAAVNKRSLVQVQQRTFFLLISSVRLESFGRSQVQILDEKKLRTAGNVITSPLRVRPDLRRLLLAATVSRRSQDKPEHYAACVQRQG